MAKVCRHVTCLSERRITSASVLGPGTGWLCLTCFREWENKTTFSAHGRSKNHPLVWVIPEGRLYCVPCSEFVNVNELNTKQKDLVETCIKAIGSLFIRPAQRTVNVTNEKTLPLPLPPTTEPELNTSHPRRPPGLHNLGNTCFMNATLQSLSAIESFSPLEECNGNLTVALFDLLSVMRDTHTLSATMETRGRRGFMTNSINPANFFDHLSNKYNFFERNEQQDSHDFLRLLFNALDDEHEEYTKKKRVASSPQNVAPHKKVFGGETVARVDCRKCQNRTCKREAFLDLSLSINPQIDIENSLESLSMQEESKSIAQLIELWQKPERLEDDNAFACENCYKRGIEDDKRDEIHKVVYSPATCRYSLEELPLSLIVHLQRFSLTRSGVKRRRSQFFGYGKDHREVSIPGKLTISETIYELKAMIIHEGATAESGHYIAIVKRNDHWYRISDSSVTLVSEETALACRHAYIVLYEQIKS